MPRFLHSCLVAAAASAAAVAFAAAPSSAATALPNSMASSGDSMTRAFDVDSACTLTDCPQYSWSTGYDTKVDSQYQRVLAANPAISGNEHNDAASGAKMWQLDGQLSSASSQGVQYLTIEMGANDLCTSSTSQMTSTANYQSQFQTAMSDFTGHDPNANILVASIPNIYQLWQLMHTNPSAQSSWNFTGLCADVLSSSATDADRQAVVTQEKADNQALATVCAQYAHCKFDNYATYNYQFTTADVSTVDYFHPSITGQNSLASVTWGAGYWPSTP